MSTFKKKILLAGMVAIFAFVVTIGATYAWFTVGQSSTVGTIDFTIQTSTSLMIVMDDVDGDGFVNGETFNAAFLADATNYVTLLTTTMIQSEYDYTDIIMTPVTTEDGLAIVREDDNPASSNPATPGEYLEFSVWVLSQDKDVTVSLMDLSVVSNESNTPEQDVIVEAIRLSAKTGDNAEDYIFGVDKEYDYVYDNLDEILGATETSLIGLHGTFYGGSVVAGEQTNILLSTSTVVSLDANVAEKVTIRVWIEGWDADCNNNALNADFAISFGFIVKEVI